MTAIKNITEHSQRSEKAIEKYLASECKKLGGKALKYESAKHGGLPDRICMLPNGVLFWVELKSKGQKPRPLQGLMIERLRDLGQRVYVADSKEMVDLILKKEYEISAAPLPD